MLSRQSPVGYQSKSKSFLTHRKSPLDQSRTEQIDGKGPSMGRSTNADIAQKCNIIIYHRGRPMATTTTIRIKNDLKARGPSPPNAPGRPPTPSCSTPSPRLWSKPNSATRSIALPKSVGRRCLRPETLCRRTTQKRGLRLGHAESNQVNPRLVR